MSRRRARCATWAARAQTSAQGFTIGATTICLNNRYVRLVPLRLDQQPAVPYHRNMEPPAVELSGYSFDQLVAFLFERDVPESKTASGKREPWYWNTEVTFDPEQICKFYTQLFQHPEFLKERFSKAQLEEGFWAMQGPHLDCSVYRIVLDTDLQFAVRARCITSMFDLFERLFASEPLDTSVHMWWDSLCYDWHCGNRNRERGGEDLQLQDIFFETLTKILFLGSDTCEGAALHGLGHLHHPGTQQLVERFLGEHPSLTEEKRAYALAAARFQVL